MNDNNPDVDKAEDGNLRVEQIIVNVPTGSPDTGRTVIWDSYQDGMGQTLSMEITEQNALVVLAGDRILGIYNPLGWYDVEVKY